jgi:hypothetical protein
MAQLYRGLIDIPVGVIQRQSSLTVIFGLDSVTLRWVNSEGKMEGPKPVKSAKVKVNDVYLYYEPYGESDPDNVVRIAPPPNVTQDQIDHALKVPDRSFVQLGQKRIFCS